MQLTLKPALSRLMPAPAPGPVLLTQRRVYILPSGHGMVFFLTLVLLLVGSINFNMSLGFALTFLLASMALVGLYHTWRNLAGLRIDAHPRGNVFAGDMVCASVTVSNRGRRARHAVAVQMEGALMRHAGIPARGSAVVDLSLPALRRGWFELPTLTVSTRFPLGLMVAWARIAPGQRCLVYPRPAGMPLPDMSQMLRGGQSGGRQGSSDFHGLRPYRAGDALRQLDWKSLAAGRELHTREFVGEGGGELWFDLDTAPGQDEESRLSQLARWVLDAERAGIRYGLRLPGETLPPDSGSGQREAALAALAVYGGSDGRR